MTQPPSRPLSEREAGPRSARIGIRCLSGLVALLSVTGLPGPSAFPEFPTLPGLCGLAGLPGATVHRVLRQAWPGPALAESPPRETAFDDSTAFELLRRLAKEDTLDLPEIDYVYGSWIEVEDRRPTLQDILRWCIDNEKSRLDGIEEVSFRRRIRVLQLYEPDKEDGKYELDEVVEQVYARPPDQIVEIELGSRNWQSEEAESEVELQADVNQTNRQMAELPFFFEQLSEYRFSITERRFLGDRILYRIDFVPRSEFASLPEGWFLIDTGDYQILRAEYALTKNVPFPVFLKSVDRVVIQRRQVDGIWWMESADLQVTLRKLPLVPMPRQIVMEMRIEDLQVNPGLPDSIWNLGGGR